MKIAGIEVEDADAPLIIKVSKTDVRAGATKKATSCAAAKALCRQEHCEEARVHFSRAYVKRNGKWERYSVPPALRSEIIAFDRGGEFAPGSYMLSPVQPTVRLDAPRTPRRAIEKRKGKHRSRGIRKRAYHVATGVRAKMMADWE